MFEGNCFMIVDGLWLIDWEYLGMVELVWDFVYFIIENGLMDGEEYWFLDVYVVIGVGYFLFGGCVFDFVKS